MGVRSGVRGEHRAVYMGVRGCSQGCAFRGTGRCRVCTGECIWGIGGVHRAVHWGYRGVHMGVRGVHGGVLMGVQEGCIEGCRVCMGVCVWGCSGVHREVHKACAGTPQGCCPGPPPACCALAQPPRHKSTAGSIHTVWGAGHSPCHPGAAPRHRADAVHRRKSSHHLPSSTFPEQSGAARARLGLGLKYIRDCHPQSLGTTAGAVP